MQECQYRHKIELIMTATIEKEYDIVKKYLKNDYRGIFTEMYISKLLDGNGNHTLRTISRNDKGVDIISYGKNYNDIVDIYQVKNSVEKISAYTVKNDFAKVFKNNEYINRRYNYIAINGYGRATNNLNGYIIVTNSELIEKKITNYSDERILDEYLIKLYDFNFIKYLIDNYDPSIEQGSISEEQFYSIYKKAIEKYIYNDSKINFNEERKLLINSYNEGSIKIEYVKALEDIQKYIDNNEKIKLKITGQTREEWWLHGLNRILTEDKLIKDTFNCNEESGWIRRQIQSLTEGSLNDTRRKYLYSVPFIETFISHYYKLKR